MFEIKFDNLIFKSNKQKIINNNIILFFYGIGCCSDDFKFLFNILNSKFNLYVVELPGHNNMKYSEDNLYSFSKKIFLFLKKKNITKITFFAHSLGGIIPIILVKNFIKKKILISNFINYEGNLTKYDTETLTKKTVSYNRDEFISCKFKSLVNKVESSGNDFLRYWSQSLKKTSPSIFYDLSYQCVHLSESNKLLSFFKTFFKKKVYIYGERTQLKMSKFTFGSVRYKIRNSGHFSFFESKSDFSRIFRKLLLKKY